MGITLTSHIDLALVMLYLFWGFFAALIYYLHQENKREGYPLDADRMDDRVEVVGFPPMPAPKTYLLADGHHVVAPDRSRDDRRAIKAVPAASFPGAPLDPTGDPMVDGVGPASYALRADHPDMTHEGVEKIVPLRVASDFFVAERDPDPRGYPVKGADGQVAGTIKDLWVDRSEFIFRYYEVELAGGGSVLLPVPFSLVDRNRKEVRVHALYGGHFAKVPRLKSPDRVTLLEEDKICGFYGGGTLYADPKRAEPLI